jgi:hypothetical protein
VSAQPNRKQQRLARERARRDGVSYQAALARVRTASQESDDRAPAALTPAKAQLIDAGLHELRQPMAFVSYSHRDEVFVLALVQKLKGHGIGAWIDRVELLIGDSLIGRIGDAIHEGDFVIAVISEHSVKSSWCDKELSLAVTYGIRSKQVKVLPVQLDGVALPSFLADILCLEADRSDCTGVAAELATAITRHLQRQQASEESGEEIVQPAGQHPAGRTNDNAGSAGITAGHRIKAGGDIESPAGIQAGHGIEAGGDIRTVPRPGGPHAVIPSPRRSDLERSSLVNRLVGHYKIRQYAAPIQHDEKATVFRVVIAADQEPTVSEFDSATKATFKDALSRSGLEHWVRQNVGDRTIASGKGWLRAQPSLGTVATFERDWGLSTTGGSVLSGKATLQLPPGFQFGSRAVLALDVIERPAEASDNQPRLTLSLADLHQFLHLLGKVAVDEIASVVFPLLCGEGKPTIIGPNYEISFGDRSLDTTMALPSSFERPANAVSNPWAEINTPEGSDPRDLTARDTVIRRGLEKVLRSNEYDEIEDEIAKLPAPNANP